MKRINSRASPIEQREFLLAAAVWQETLLQSYRSIHVTIQGLLIAAGAAVLAVQLAGATQQQTERLLTNAIFNLVITCLLAFILWLQRKTANELKGVVDSRAADINHWHRLTILAENAFDPDQRAFTFFKIWQHAHRADVTHVLPRYLPQEGLSEPAADELIGKGLGHTRRVLEVNLFERLLLLSKAMLIASFGVSSWFILVWYRSTNHP